MNLSSTRVRLTLWNVAMMAVVLLIVFTAVRYALEARLISEVDSRISTFAGFLVEMNQEPPPPRPDDDHAGGPPPPFRDAWRRRHMSRRPADEFPPAVLDTHGSPMHPDDSHGIIDQQGFEVALTGHPNILSTQIKGAEARVCSAPILHDGEIVGVVQVARSLTAIHNEIRHLVRTVLIISPFALLVAGFCGAFLTGRALRPVREFSTAAAQISAENLNRRLPVSGRDEFAQLAATFNSSLDRLQDSFERLEESLEQQRRLTADASHELRTPLTVIKAHASLALSKKQTSAQYVSTLNAIDQAADVMSRIVQDLLLLARADAGQLTVQHDEVMLSEAIGMALDATNSLEGPNVVTSELDNNLTALGDVHLLARVFTNILSNAKRHTPVTGEITLAVDDDGDTISVVITDTGEGIPPEALPHIGERFYRVDTARARSKGGTGLGLAICRTIVAAHGGELALTSSQGAGTQVTVRLPGARAHSKIS